MIAVRSFALLLLFLKSYAVFPQKCDEKIREMGKSLGSLGYQPRTPQIRCEGLYYDNVNGVTIDLVSLTRGRIRYQLRGDEIISIHKLNGIKDEQLLVRGTSFRSSPKYRLDTSWDKNKNAIQLPLKEVLNESRISSTDVGFYGYLEKPGLTIYFPVVTTTKYYQAPESDKVYLTLLSNIETSQIVYKIAEKTNGSCGTFSGEVKLDTGYEKMEPIEIEVPQGKTSRELCVEVFVLPAGTNQSWKSRQFTLLVPSL